MYLHNGLHLAVLGFLFLCTLRYRKRNRSLIHVRLKEPNVTGFGIQFCKYSVESFFLFFSFLFTEVKISSAEIDEVGVGQGIISIFCSMIFFTKSQIRQKCVDFHVHKFFSPVLVSNFLCYSATREAHVSHFRVTTILV